MRDKPAGQHRRWKGCGMVAKLTGYDGAPDRRDRSGERTQDRGKLSLWVVLLLIGLVIPLFVFLGPLRLSAYRVVLIAAFFPALFFWLSGRTGPIRLPDICVLIICLWSTLSFSVVHGFGPMIDTIGILWVETLGAYLLARCFIRTPEAFFAVARLLFIIALVMLPFAAYELNTGKNLLLNLFGKIGPVYSHVIKDSRLGLERVQGPFAHQIHFGVFFGALIGIFYFVLGYGRSWLGRVTRAGLGAFHCFAALSSGPLAAAIAQLSFLIWDGTMKSVRSRWYILTGLAILAYVVVDMISNRTPFHVFVTYFSFNVHTAYNRILIWQFGSASIWANPIFGVGYSDVWERPYWMSPSIDMFWIVPAMRHGVVVWVAYLTLFFSAFMSVVYCKGLSDRVQWYRMGYLCSMFGLFIVGWTVHFWDALFVLFMFILASGLWILDWKETDRPDEETPSPSAGGIYSRFPPRARKR